MSAVESQAATLGTGATTRRMRANKAFDIGALILTLITVIFAVLWAFPIYWALVTSLKPEQQAIAKTVEFLPRTWTMEAYWHVVLTTTCQ